MRHTNGNSARKWSVIWVCSTTKHWDLCEQTPVFQQTMPLDAFGHQTWLAGQPPIEFQDVPTKTSISDSVRTFLSKPYLITG